MAEHSGISASLTLQILGSSLIFLPAAPSWQSGWSSGQKVLNPSRMSAGKDLGMYFSVSGVQTRKHSLFCFCGCYVSAGHTSPCFWTPSPLHSWPTMWSKEGERGGPSWTLPGDQIVWCPAEVPEIRSESWRCTERHKTLPVPPTAAVAMANPNNIPQLPTLSQPSSVGRRRWELLTGGNLETAEAERGPSRQTSPEAVQTSCLRAARLCFPEFFTWLLSGKQILHKGRKWLQP